MNHDNNLVKLSDGEITMWIENGSAIHMKAISPHGDPVELSAEEANALAGHLLRLASLVR
jgi:hypothetical protein